MKITIYNISVMRVSAGHWRVTLDLVDGETSAITNSAPLIDEFNNGDAAAAKALAEYVLDINEVTYTEIEIL